MNSPPQASNFGKWMALAAALLGWLFDGLEMGLFPLVAKPALEELLADQTQTSKYLGIITALFLVGAATGGVLFGWLGDRIGRVRSMMLSVLTYALVSGLCGFATTAWQIGVLRFIAALGMGGEWSLGVALINEIWPDRSRAFLAGLIGAAANVGYLLIALVGMGLTSFIGETRGVLLALHLSEEWVDHLLQNKGWRLLMMFGALPALLTFLIRLYVPESTKWEHERDTGSTSHWKNRDLIGVLIGSLGTWLIVGLWTLDFEKDLGWSKDYEMPIRIAGSVFGFFVALIGFIYPVYCFLQRSESAHHTEEHQLRPTLKRMLLAAVLSGVALLGTWGTTQQAPSWAAMINTDQVKFTLERENTQAMGALGAVFGTILAALIGGRFGRRITYFVLCIASFISVQFFFEQRTYGYGFLASMFVTGAITAAFYGWLPLYLPELFRTNVRATGQGFAFNFGRILAAIGVLQLGPLTAWFSPDDKILGLAKACAFLSWIYAVGLIVIWFVPETKGKPLPE